MEEEEGGGNFLTKKIMGLPVIVWVGGVAILAFLYFSHKSKSSSGGGKGGGGGLRHLVESGGGGKAKSGGVNISPNAIRINVGQPEKTSTSSQQGTVYRHVSGGTLSLDQLAADRNTTVKHIETATLDSGLLSAANRTAFQDYVKGGTNKIMPKGLVYYTTTGPAEG